jgi:hypothetical protein
MLQWIAKLECPNPDCIFGKHIELPYSSHQQIAGNQPDWPKGDWQAFVVCRACGSGRIYSKSNVRWGLAPLAALDIWVSTAFLQIELKCAREDCETPVRVHMLYDRNWQRNPNDLERKLALPIGDPRCVRGHKALEPIRIQNVWLIGDFGEAKL